MRKNTVKETLANGGIAIGTMVFEFNTSGVSRIAGEAGAEFVIFDMEHTGWSIETIRNLVRYLWRVESVADGAGPGNPVPPPLPPARCRGDGIDGADG